MITRLRSILFAIFLPVVTLLMGVALCWTLLAPRIVAREAVRLWAGSVLIGLRVICGLRHEIRGCARLPQGGVLIASKHQSMWDTIIPFLVFHDPAIILKRELMRIPIYGWWAWKLDMIPIDRKGGAKTLRAMQAAAKKAIERGREVVIFPEGTRRAPGAAPAYQPGVAGLYKALGAPVAPVALNSGHYWINGSVDRKPGIIRWELLETIPPDLDRRAFLRLLEERIEPAVARIEAEAQGEQT